MDSGERGVNPVAPVALTIINPLKEYWSIRASNQQPPVFNSCMLLYRLSYGQKNFKPVNIEETYAGNYQAY